MNCRKEQFLAYYNQYKHKIYNYFLYRVNFNRETAEDLTSDVFLKALKKIDTYDENQSFQAWILTIAHNHLVDHYKSQKKQVALEEVFDLSGSGKKDMENQVVVHELLEQVQKLPDYYREVVVLKHINGLNTREIADILKKEEGAVRTALHRALKFLREEMAECV